MSDKKVLLVTKPDGTNHIVPLANKPFLQQENTQRPQGAKWTFKEITEDEAKTIPYVDPNFVSASDAQQKLKDAQTENAAKDNRIAELEKLLAEKNGAGTTENTTPQKKASDLIAEINAATTVEEVNALVEGDARATVLAAAEKKRKSFE